jgi:hypothetical protein
LLQGLQVGQGLTVLNHVESVDIKGAFFARSRIVRPDSVRISHKRRPTSTKGI